MWLTFKTVTFATGKIVSLTFDILGEMGACRCEIDFQVCSTELDINI